MLAEAKKQEVSTKYRVFKPIFSEKGSNSETKLFGPFVSKTNMRLTTGSPKSKVADSNGYDSENMHFLPLLLKSKSILQI